MITRPNIPLPDSIGLAVSTRQGGVSEGCYGANNMALHVGDEPQAVERNREALLAELEGAEQIQWLNQTHGINVVEAGLPEAPNADACFSTKPGQACAVMTADCLPILLWRKDGQGVAAVHAGWRGLAAGIVAPALAALKAKPADVGVYLGPAISQPCFEVSVDVLETFFESARSVEHLNAISAASLPSLSHPLKYHLDLYALARAELNALGVDAMYGGDECSFGQDDRYYSYRRSTQQREPATGRMASLIWRK